MNAEQRETLMACFAGAALFGAAIGGSIGETVGALLGVWVGRGRPLLARPTLKEIACGSVFVLPMLALALHDHGLL